MLQVAAHLENTALCLVNGVSCVTKQNGGRAGLSKKATDSHP